MASVLPPCVSSISSSPGEWDCPSIELSKTTWDASDVSRPVTVQGTVHLDTRFFRRPLLDATAPFAITVALTAPGTGSLRPLDWNQEDAERTGLAKSATSNPRSNIILHERTGVDRHLCRLTFTIAVPPALFLLPTSPTTRAQSSLGPSPTEETHIREREFGVAVKAFDITGRVTQTNVVQFLIRARVPRPSCAPVPTLLSPSSARSGMASTNTSSRRSSVSQQRTLGSTPPESES
ncbi:hypothetical protein BS47DRAFT_715872 [Hydnum rufescens UP504]|uniref:Uncharacterized protein n=1 Tax=Hydnum rufescens UP504 TaxID=1448309 RepID=A0A9P6B1R4_9AGAM|nr:hypothetical protein BS47DRAFT_715872 [Hydnum rufescens UP504]